MAMQQQFVDTNEPFHDVDAEALANQQMYGVMSGCALTYDSGNLTVDIAAGVVMHNGLPVTVAAQANAVTLVADGSNNRWSWIGVNSSGTGVLISGTAGTTPAKPEYSTDIVPLGLVLVDAGLTLADQASQRLDKRTPVRYLGHKGTDISSATTLVTPSGGGNFFHVTGTTTITTLMAGYSDGNEITLVFDGVLTLTHNSTRLILQGGGNVTTAAGDVFVFANEGSNNWREVSRRLNSSSIAVQFAGSQTTEATMSSTTAQDLVTVSSLSIAAAPPFIVCGSVRKTGTTDTAGIGLKLNSTVVDEADLTSANALWNTVAGAAVSGAFFLYVAPRVTNYLRSAARMNGSEQGGADDAFNMGDANMPTATITSVIIRGDMGGSTDTLGVDEVFVYTLATS